MKKIFTNKMGYFAAALAAGAISTIFMTTSNQTTASAAEVDKAAVEALTKDWTGPFSGVPAFGKVKVEAFAPALEEAMAEQLQEVNSIANNRAVPTFENTIAAMEKAGSKMERVSTVYYIWAANMNSPEFAKVQREMAPKLAAFNDKITQNEGLFKKI